MILYRNYPTTENVLYKRFCGHKLVSLVLWVALEEELSLPGRHGGDFGLLGVPVFLLLLLDGVGCCLLLSSLLHNVFLPPGHALQKTTY